MTTHITKTWFDGDKVLTQVIPESKAYKQEPVATYTCGVCGVSMRMEVALPEAQPAPVQEPVAWAMDYDIESVLSGFSTSLIGTAMRIESAFPKHRVKLLYTHPPQRTWVGLTDTQIEQVYFETVKKHRGTPMPWGQVQFGKALEAKLKEMNT